MSYVILWFFLKGIDGSIFKEFDSKNNELEKAILDNYGRDVVLFVFLRLKEKWAYFYAVGNEPQRWIEWVVVSKINEEADEMMGPKSPAWWMI